MEYALIAALLLIVILPALAILPSPRERQQARMRHAATAAGVAVRLASLPAPAARRPGAQLRVVAYGVQRPKGVSGADWRLQRRPARDAREPRLGGLAVDALPKVMSQTFLTFLETQVGKLPPDVEQVQEEAGAITIYWHERQAGTERQVIDFLRHCAALGA